MKTLLKYIVFIYKKFISPCLPPSCRFYPSCSNYTYDAINIYGTTKGIKLSILRILKCHPLNPGGYDPIPNINSDKKYK